MNNLDTSVVLDREDVFSQDKNDELAESIYGDSSKNRRSVEEEELLVDQSDLLTSDGENIRNNKWLHLISTLIVGSFFAILAYVCFSMFGKIMTAGQRQPVTQQTQIDREIQKSQARIRELQEKLDHKDAQLAFNKKDTSQWQKIEPKPKPKPTLVRRQPTSQPQPEAQPAVVPASQPQQEFQQPIEADPLEEWSRLSAIGTANGETQSTEIAASTLENRADNSEAKAISQVTPADYTSKSSAAISSSNVANTLPISSSERELNLGIEKGSVAQIASVSIGATEPEPDESSTSGLDLKDPEVANLISDEPLTDNYLGQKQRQSIQQENLSRLSSLGSASVSNSSTSASFVADVSSESDISSTSAPLSTRYLEQKKRQSGQQERLEEVSPAENTSVNNLSRPASFVADVSSEPDISSKQVPQEHNILLGNSVEGTLAQDIVLSDGLKPSQSRGIIYITEPLLAEDGSVALPENSAIVVEAQVVNTSGLVQLQAIALSYEDSSGKLVQEALPKNSILIQGKEEALLAQRTNGNGGSNLGQDILLAGLGAGEKAFELANEPEVVREGYDHYNYRDSSYDPDRSRYDNNFYEPNEFSYGTRKSDEASLITGAAEGAFSTTKSRLENRSIQIDQERASENPIFQLEAGTDVSIFVNSFLTIER